MKRLVAVLVFLTVVWLMPAAPAWSEDSSDEPPSRSGLWPGYTSVFETSAVMDFYKALCNIDEVGGAGVGDCFESNTKMVRQKYDLLHSRLLAKNWDLCAKQKTELSLSKKSLETYTANMCRSVNSMDNTYGYVSEQYCILQLTIQGDKNLMEFASHMQRARSCEAKK